MYRIRAHERPAFDVLERSIGIGTNNINMNMNILGGIRDMQCQLRSRILQVLATLAEHSLPDSHLALLKSSAAVGQVLSSVAR